MLDRLIPAMITPFDAEGELDLDSCAAVVEGLVEAGVSGVAALGSTGEFSHLTAEERRRLAEALPAMVGGRVPLLIGVGATGTREAISLAQHAAGAGADAVVCVSPFYWKVGEEALFGHFASVAEASEVPVVVYNFPALTGIDLSPSLVRRLAEECPNVIGLKDTVSEYMHTVRVLREVKPVRPDFAALAGIEDQILPALLAGADGAISGLSNVAPQLFVDLVSSVEKGDLERAAELHRRVLSLMRLADLSDPPIGAFKAAMSELGFPISPIVRGPALPLPQGSEEDMRRVLGECGLV